MQCLCMVRLYIIQCTELNCKASIYALPVLQLTILCMCKYFTSTQCHRLWMHWLIGWECYLSSLFDTFHVCQTKGLTKQHLVNKLVLVKLTRQHFSIPSIHVVSSVNVIHALGILHLKNICDLRVWQMLLSNIRH